MMLADPELRRADDRGGVRPGGAPHLTVQSFAAGMSLMDTADGAFMSQAYGWAFSNPVKKVTTTSP